ncbi:MAG: FkbM family methyltransferase [Acidobacteria bacterium]|nr:FkbM family methyltransferase [Acidobacteriota bacterium]
MGRKLAVWLIRGLIVLIVAGTARSVMMRFPMTHLVLAALTGDRCVCSVTKALISYQANDRRQSELMKSYARVTRRVRSDLDGFVLWQSPDGEFWMPPGAEWLLPHLLAEQARQIYGQGRLAPQKDDVVLDCGAHVGVFARKALKAGAATVVEIEPAPENLVCLRRNFAGEIASGRVLIVPAGVWDKPDILEFHRHSDNSGRDSFLGASDAGKRDGKVPLTTIDRIVQDLRLPRVNLIKMDIEGAEKLALTGAHETLRRFRPRLAIAAYHEEHDSQSIQKIVRDTVPAYRFQCGPYTEWSSRIVPEALLFW